MAYETTHRPAHRPPRRLRAALLLVGVVAVLCAVGAAGLGVWSYQAVRGAAGPARAAVERFLTRLVDGDAAGAYGQLCTATRRRWTQPDFTRRVVTEPRLIRYAVRDVRVTGRAGQQAATVTAQLVPEAGPPRIRTVPVIRDGDAWRVCGDPY